MSRFPKGAAGPTTVSTEEARIRERIEAWARTVCSYDRNDGLKQSYAALDRLLAKLG